MKKLLQLAWLTLVAAHSREATIVRGEATVNADTVRKRFEDVYPQWYRGDALVTQVGDQLTVLNSHENEDVTEAYDVPLKRGNIVAIEGRISPHAYLMGKFEDGDRRFWFQANGEYAERDTQITVTCRSRPRVKIAPEAVAKVERWDPAAGKLVLELSHADGAVEVELQ